MRSRLHAHVGTLRQLEIQRFLNSSHVSLCEYIWTCLKLHEDVSYVIPVVVGTSIWYFARSKLQGSAFWGFVKLRLKGRTPGVELSWNFVKSRLQT